MLSLYSTLVCCGAKSALQIKLDWTGYMRINYDYAICSISYGL